MLKTTYKVKSSKLSLILSRDKGSERFLFKKGDIFEAFPYEIPLGFSDLVESLGPAEPELSSKEEINTEDVEDVEKEEVQKPIRKKEAIRKTVDPPVVNRVVKRK